MSQFRLGLLTTICLALVFTFNAMGNQPFTGVAFILSCVSCIFFVGKQIRDEDILNQAKAELKAAQQVTKQVPLSSKGSHGLFVPPSIED